VASGVAGGRLAAVAVATAALALPAGAAAGTRGPLNAPTAATESHEAAPDRVLPVQSPSLRRTAARSNWGRYRLLDGAVVKAASTYYPESEILEVVGVLGTLIHGREMNTVSVYLATEDELAAFCGSGFAACYAPSDDRIVVPGSDEPVAGVPREHLIAHEYGHHIANHRINGPWWPALYGGAKRWATYERVCEEAHQGRLYPGDSGTHYWENPGEGFAESYARLNFPELGLAWNYTPLLEPDAGALARLAADVSRPWEGRRTRTWRRSFGHRQGRAVRTFRTPLDGRLTVKLAAPRDSRYRLSVSTSTAGGWRLLRRPASLASAERLDARVCGTGAVRVEVRRRAGTGPFRVEVTRP
jgi:hypothetical protein